MKASAGAAARAGPEAVPAAVREAVQIIWESAFPAALQDAAFLIVDVNAAFCEFSGYPRAALLGRDINELLPKEDQRENLEKRKRLRASSEKPEAHYLSEGRIVDAGGIERWFRVSRRALEDERGQPLYFSFLQDTTLEHAARERADRSIREIDDWFDLSPFGMVLFDDSGLLVRTNPAFDEMAGSVPVSLADSAPSLARLLAWRSASLTGLQPGSRPIETLGSVEQPGGRSRSLRSIVRCYRTANGERRYMGIVEDRSVEEERDLAQMQIGALMDTAGVGIATFQESSGWVRQLPAANASPSASLHNISREIVMAESLPEYERLQAALKKTQRTEVRYAIQHPELGQRWLLTRVEPATLASGKKTTSVVTIDITDQRQSQRRSEQLLREMTTILESTTTGIAYLRGGVLVRCNRRFEALLRLGANGVAGSSLAELLSSHPHAEQVAADIRGALATDATYEMEFAFEAGEPEPEETRWYSLSVRRAGVATGLDEAIAVLADVTRMKTQQVELEVLARDRELMFSLSDVGIAFLRDGRIERANDALSNLTGWPVSELSSLPVAELFAGGEESDSRRDLEERELRVHGRWSGERQLRRRDGRLVWVQTALRPVDQREPAAGVIASYVNVDARHRAESAVALQAERTRSILDSVLVGIVTVGANGIEWMNRSARRMLGGTLADFLGQSISAVATTEPDHPFRQTQFLDELVEGQAETFECRVRARDGREFWIVGNAVATGREATGRQLTYALLDIERRRQAEAAASHAEATLREVMEARFEAEIAQRDMLVKEVHHRIKNNLQGVAGLLQQIALRKPEVAAAIDEVVGQVQAIAQVYGLQVGTTGPLSVVSVLEAIVGSVQRTFGRSIVCSVEGASAAEWMLPEVEAIPIALTLNELLTNAVKHSPAAAGDVPIACTLHCGDAEVALAIANAAQLPAGFSLGRIPNGVSGLGLVRALLPRRSAAMTIEQRGDRVVATVTLAPPGVVRAGA